MFTIYYKEKRQLDPRAGTKYATEYYNGISLANKKQLAQFSQQALKDVDYVCDEITNSDAIRYFHNPSKAFPRDNRNEHSKLAPKKYRTPYEALKEFHDYITTANTMGGIPQQMINRWNKVWIKLCVAPHEYLGETRMLDPQEKSNQPDNNNEGYSRLFG